MLQSPPKTPGILEGQGEEKGTLLAILGAGVGLGETGRHSDSPKTSSQTLNALPAAVLRLSDKIGNQTLIPTVAPAPTTVGRTFGTQFHHYLCLIGPLRVHYCVNFMKSHAHGGVKRNEVWLNKPREQC